MKILLISANQERMTMLALPYGMACVAAQARAAGHCVETLDLLFAQDPQQAITDAISRSEPDLIGISIRNVDNQDIGEPRFLLDGAAAVVRVCRAASEAPLVLGGAGYSIFPEAALEHLGADMGIQGEGEEAFCGLLERLEAGRSPEGLAGLVLRGRGLMGERRFTANLDGLAWPDYDELIPSQARDGGLWAPFQLKRGCPMRCSYCSTGAIEGRSHRFRSVEAVVKQLGALAEAGLRRFYFIDNTFNHPTARAMALCRALEGLGLTWRCILYPWGVDRALVKAMARAGCVEVSLGFESGSASVLRAMNKRFGPQEIRQVCEMLGAQGIRRMGFLLLGGPGETRATVEESLAFADGLGLEMMRVTRGIRVYPGTPLAEEARRRGVVGADDDLLRPRFYLEPDLRGWLEEALAPWRSARPHWIL